jgi:quercetin dioxygenase-like cupin family protein
MRTKPTVILIVAVILAVICWFGIVRATPSVGFTASTIAVGRFGDIDVSNHAIFPNPSAPDSPRGRNLWLSIQKTKGPSDLYVQSNLWVPGGTSGWHTHPGHSLIIVTAGSVTAYESDDPSCTPHVYTAGQGFVDEGGDHVHLIRNEGIVEAKTVAVQLVQAGATRRIDAPASAHCSF